MNLTFEYTPENLQEAYSLHFKRNSPLKGRMMLYLGSLLLWTGGLLMAITMFKGRQVLSISFLAYGVIVICIHYWLMKSLGKRMYKRMKDYHGAIIIDVNNEGFTLTVEKGQSSVDWESIQYAVITNSIALLYPAKNSFYIFPKADFKEGEFDAFTSLVKEKVSVIK